MKYATFHEVLLPRIKYFRAVTQNMHTRTGFHITRVNSTLNLQRFTCLTKLSKETLHWLAITQCNLLLPFLVSSISLRAQLWSEETETDNLPMQTLSCFLHKLFLDTSQWAGSSYTDEVHNDFRDSPCRHMVKGTPSIAGRSTRNHTSVSSCQRK